MKRALKYTPSIAVAVIVGIGWWRNLMVALDLIGDPNFTFEQFIRGVGIIVPPLGAILGYFL